MNNRNKEKTSQVSNTASNEEIFSHQNTFNSDVEFSSNFAVNLLKNHLYLHLQVERVYT